MAKYKTIKGFTIQSLASDPVTSVAGSGTWASGGNLNTGRFPIAGATNAPATSTGLGFGGTAPGPAKTGKTESYDGTTWTEKGDLNDARIAMGGAGTATAALGFGGDSPGYPTATESFNGTSWTVVPATLSQGKDSAAGFGLQTAAIYATGYNGVAPAYDTAKTDSYNGTAWSEVNNVNTARSYVYGCGTQTSGIIAGGSEPPYSAAAETWNGTCWTTVNSINTARANFAMFGTQTFAVGSGGDDGSTPRFASVEAYDGTSWTEVANLANANKMSASSGTAGTAGINFGGSDPGNNPMTRTEEWTTAAPPISIVQEGQVWYNSTSNVLKGYGKTAGTGTWASTGQLNTIRPNNSGGGSGIQTAALAAGGYSPPTPTNLTTATESYNGSVWTETGHAMNTARYNTAMTGTQTASLIFGGNQVSPDHGTLTEEYNGSSWAVKNALPLGRASGTAAGTTTAAMAYGGRPIVTTVLDFDGTNWSTGTALSTARDQPGGGGTNTDAACVGGGPPVVGIYEAWNGTAWTEKADLNTSRRAAAACVTTTDSVMLAGGQNGGSDYNKTEVFNGTSWSEEADQATEHYKNASAGNATAGLAIAPTDSPYALCEEWNVPSPLTVQTFTSS